MAKLVSRLSLIAEKSDELIEPAVRETADEILGLTKQLSPVDTGQLRESYETRQGRDFKQMFIGTIIGYSVFMEYGFVHYISGKFVGPFAHLSPAFAHHEKTFEKKLKAQLKKLEKV